LNGGNCLRSDSAARNAPGTAAVRLLATACSGGMPAAIKAGNVTTAAPPTIAVNMPPATPATTSSRKFCTSMR
jgi:hypothetical protein